MEEAPQEAFLAFKESEAEEVAVDEVGEGAEEEGEFGIFPFVLAHVTGIAEAVFRIEQLGGFAQGIVVVLLRPPAEIVEVVVAESFFPKEGGAVFDDDLLVHDIAVAMGLARAEETDKGHKSRATFDELTQKRVCAQEFYAGVLLFHRGQFLEQSVNQAIVQIFVCVDSQHPVCCDVQRVKRPIELFGLISGPIVLNDFNVGIFSADFLRAVCGMTVDDIDLFRYAKDVFNAASDVEAFVEGEDEGGEGEHGEDVSNVISLFFSDDFI